MSAADSEESRWPDFATASIRTQSSRSTVAQRSSSAIEGFASARSASFGGGLGSGTGVRCLTSARLAADPIPFAGYGSSVDGTVRPDSPKRASRDPCAGEELRSEPASSGWPSPPWRRRPGSSLLSGDEEGGGPPEPAGGRTSHRAERSGASGAARGPRHDPADAQGTRAAVREAVRSSPAPRLDADQREVARVVRAYVAALDARDGGRACGLFVPGALARGRLPARPGKLRGLAVGLDRIPGPARVPRL